MMFVFLLLFGVVVVLVVGQSTTFPALCSVPTNAAQLGGDSRPFDGYSEDYGSVICSSGVSLQPIAGYKSHIFVATYNETLLGFLVTVTLGNSSVGVFDRTGTNSGATIMIGVPQNCVNQAAKDASAVYLVSDVSTGGVPMYQSVVLSLQIPASARGVATLKALLLVTDGVQQRFRIANSTFTIVADATLPAMPVCSAFRTSVRSGTAPGCFCGGKCYSNDTWQFARLYTLESSGQYIHWATIISPRLNDAVCGLTTPNEPFPNGTATSTHLKSLGCKATTVYGFCDAAQNDRQCCMATGCASCNKVPDRCDSCGKGYVLYDPYPLYGQCLPIELNSRPPRTSTVPSVVDCNGNVTVSFLLVVDEPFDHVFDITVNGISGLLASYKIDSTPRDTDVPDRHVGDTITLNISMPSILQRIDATLASIYRNSNGSVGPFYVQVTSMSISARSNNFTTRTCCIAGCECVVAATTTMPTPPPSPLVSPNTVCRNGLVCTGGRCCLRGTYGCSCNLNNYACSDGSVCGSSDQVCMTRTDCTNTSRLGDACAVANTFLTSFYSTDSGTSPFACINGLCQCGQKLLTQLANAACGTRDAPMELSFRLAVNLGVPSPTLDAACSTLASRHACVRSAVLDACADFEVADFCSNANMVDRLRKVNCTTLCDKFVSPVATTSAQRLPSPSSIVSSSSSSGMMTNANQSANSTLPAVKSDSLQQPPWLYAAVGGGAGGGLVLIIVIAAVAVCLCKKRSSSSGSETSKSAPTNQRVGEENSFARGMVSVRDERTTTTTATASTYGNMSSAMMQPSSGVYNAMPSSGASVYSSPQNVHQPAPMDHYDGFVGAHELAAMNYEAQRN